MVDPTEAIDQELRIASFHLMTTYGVDVPPEVAIIAEVVHDSSLTWVQRLTFTREQLEQLITLLHHTVSHDETGVHWP